jgi:HAD superfamily 5'-nucleotidase-like hydrolase
LAKTGERGLFCNRTLNLRSIRAIGYDMDYTLIHYRVEEWERRAFEYTRENLAAGGWPVQHLEFDPTLVMRGLVLDLELGNIVKPNRFGYVIKATHGTEFLDFDTQRKVYARTMVDLSEPRYVFLNTLFSLSEACIFAQLVELLDEGKITGLMNYADLYAIVRSSLDAAHVEGALKAEILGDPDRFVITDPDLPLTLLDQRHAGKKLLLITNSEWSYTRSIMSYAVDPFLPKGSTWRDLFDIVIVSARKPAFFFEKNPLFEVVDEEMGLLRPSRKGLDPGAVYFGGNASLVEQRLGLSGDEILYVGDHLYGDVHVTKAVLRWRTALILRELEEEIAAVEQFEPRQAELTKLMAEKERMEAELCRYRVAAQRKRVGYAEAELDENEESGEAMNHLRTSLAELDERISPLAKGAGELNNSRWGLLLRAGNDKNIFARQLERYADVYTSRVSNFLRATPYLFLRAPRGTLPHDD